MTLIRPAPLGAVMRGAEGGLQVSLLRQKEGDMRIYWIFTKHPWRALLPDWDRSELAEAVMIVIVVLALLFFGLLLHEYGGSTSPSSFIGPPGSYAQPEEGSTS